MAELERALAEEMTGHPDYEKHDPAERGRANSRNGNTSATSVCRPESIYTPRLVEPRLPALHVPRQRAVPLSGTGLTRDLFPKQEPLHPLISKAPGHEHLLHLALPLKCNSPERGARF
jgi:hypothetical protein